MPEAPELIPRACHNVKMNSDPESLLVRVSEVSKPTRGTRYLVNITKYLIESVWCASLPYNSISTSWPENRLLQSLGLLRGLTPRFDNATESMQTPSSPAADQQSMFLSDVLLWCNYSEEGLDVLRRVCSEIVVNIPRFSKGLLWLYASHAANRALISFQVYPLDTSDMVQLTPHNG
ncbi:hypothetical protein AB1N83_009317 [Pleurotus pulmonarius]